MRNISRRGFTLLEMLIYVALLAAIATLTTLTLLSVGKSYSSLKASQRLNASAIAAIGRMGAEVRAAESIGGGSTFGTSPGLLQLASGATTTEFYLSNGALRVRRNGIEGGVLSDSNTTVSELVFYSVNNGTSQGVKVRLGLSTTEGKASASETFHSFFILRGSY